MHLGELEEYEARERAHARATGRACAPSGFIRDLKPLFADQRFPRRLGVHRSGAPLDFLLLLYPSTIVYVPPTSKKQLEARVGMPVRELVELQRYGFVCPVIGHPTDYAGLDYFDELLERRPPSIWARGDEVAHAYADAGAYWDEVRERVPLSEMARLPWVRAKWRRHWPQATEDELTSKIKIELGTNYVDLCIFGYGPLAQAVVGLEDVDWVARRLLELNEVATYPQLIGAGGTLNYGIGEAAVIEAVQQDLLMRPSTRFLGPEAEIISTGLGLPPVSRLGAEELKAFHESGAAKRLWKALDLLEAEVQPLDAADSGDDALREAAAQATSLVKEAVRESETISYSSRRTTMEERASVLGQVMKVAPSVGVGATATLAYGENPVAALLATAGTLSFAHTVSQLNPVRKRLLQRLDDAIVDHLMSREFTPLTTQFWWLRKLAPTRRRGK